MTDPRDLLQRYSTIVVVGISTDPRKPAHYVPAQMKAAGYRIIPVNPMADSILGEKVYPSLDQVPCPVEVVEVFRPSPQAADVVRQAVAVGARAVWLQSGIRSAEARAVAEEAGLDYVEDLCMAVEVHRHGISKISKPT